MDRACSTNGGEEECVYDVDWKARRRPLGRPRCRCVDNIKMDLGEIGCGGMDWICLAQEGSCEHDNEPSGSIKC
jgi:hypothetical protein